MIDDNKALIRRYFDLLNRNNLPTEEFLANGFVYHRPGMPDMNGLASIRQFVAMWGDAISDAHGTIEDMVAEGDKVACRCSFRGIHKGDLMGIAATGKQITLTGIVIYRLREPSR
jgi:predicted ester cyclase